VRAQDGDQQQVEQAVQHGLLARLVLDDLVGEQRHERRVDAVDDQRRQRAQQPAADLPRRLVDARHQDRLTFGGVAPRARAEVVQEIERLPVRLRAALAGVDQRLDGRREVVGDRVRARAAGDRHVPRVQPDGFLAVAVDQRRAAHGGDHREWRLVLDAQAPGRIEREPEQERAAGARAVEKSGDGVHGFGR
jgi:hypothetical protein